MAKIIQVIGLDNKHAYGNVHVVLDDGTECTIYIGGSVEVFFDKGKIKAFMKRRSDDGRTKS